MICSQRELDMVTIQEAVNRILDCWDLYCSYDITWAELKRIVNEHLDACEQEAMEDKGK